MVLPPPPAAIIEQSGSQGALNAPVDQPGPDRFGDALAIRDMNRDQLLRWVQSHLVQGTDFGSIPGSSKPSLWQPGAQKICGMLSLVASFPDVEKYVDRCVAGEQIDTVLIRCYLSDAAGNVVAQGSGARDAVKQKPIYQGRGPDRKRTGTEEYRDLNYAIKMAQKSAHIDATNRASGLSAVFTQDHPAEDENIEPIKGTAEEAYLLQLSGELFGADKAFSVLESLAMRRFRIKDGDWTQIPQNRLTYAVNSLRDKRKGDET